MYVDVILWIWRWTKTDLHSKITITWCDTNEILIYYADSSYYKTIEINDIIERKINSMLFHETFPVSFSLSTSLEVVSYVR